MAGWGGSNISHSTKLTEDLTQFSSGRSFLKVLMTVWAYNAEEVQTERSGGANTKLFHSCPLRVQTRFPRFLALMSQEKEKLRMQLIWNNCYDLEKKKTFIYLHISS